MTTHPTFRIIHSDGVVRNKAEEIASIMSSDLAGTDMKKDDIKVRVFGDVAVVTALVTYTAAKGVPPGVRRHTDILVKRSGRWVQVGSQLTLLPPT